VFFEKKSLLPDEAQLIIIQVMECVIHNDDIKHEISIYHQTDRVVMGQVLSVMVANIVM